MTSKQNQLVDSDYIRRMDKEKWSLTEAVYLLHGLVPPKTESTIDQLIKDIIEIQRTQNAPKRRRLEAKIHAFNHELNNRYGNASQSKIDPELVSKDLVKCEAYLADLEKFPNIVTILENLPKPKYEKLLQCPEDWVEFAMRHDVVMTICWKAIFIQMINDNFQFHNGKPDYHRFIQVFVSDTKTRLGKLAEYVLSPGDNTMIKPPADKPMLSRTRLVLFDDLLEFMNTALGLNATDTGELPGKLVSPQEFIKLCPRRYFIPPNPYLWWKRWSAEYPKLAARLKASGKAKLTNCQISTPDQQEGHQSSEQDESEPTQTRNTPLKILIMRYLKKTNGKDDFLECLEFLLKDAEVDEDGDGRIWYMSFSKKPQTPLISSVRKSFNKYRKEWLSLNH